MKPEWRKVGRLIVYDFWTAHIHQYVHVVIITIAWANSGGEWVMNIDKVFTDTFSRTKKD